MAKSDDEDDEGEDGAKEEDEEANNTTTLFVKNLNIFPPTTEEALRAFFERVVVRKNAPRPLTAVARAQACSPSPTACLPMVRFAVVYWLLCMPRRCVWLQLSESSLYLVILPFCLAFLVAGPYM